MINLQNRSLQNELLDAEGIPFAHIQKNMQELNTINSLLGGHAITIKGLKSFLSPTKKSISICEMGCGGGDNLNAIYKYCQKNNIQVQLTGIDIKEECILFAREKNPQLNANWISSDYRLAIFKDTPDIVFSSLFCHHFSQKELIEMLGWMNRHCRQGFFINDLQRHPLAYYAIKWITQLFSRSYLVKNDAPLSVARGFTKNEWQQIFAKAGITHYSISWKWAFRYLIVCKK
jgi:ubiquinone/menaquinone biosynthesis C-methylase UbiE